ncbi:O-antigen ligase family protein [Deinococcus radiophilus]|nr:O-antigen ligase family protein [Deinococcus radiophilus]UFA51508.1 O-antigen ligase family protein [Deinococcus radiophilus]
MATHIPMAAPTPVPKPGVPRQPSALGGGRLLAAAQLFPPLGAGVLGWLGRVRELPTLLQAALGIFVLTQVVAALLTAQPLLSLGLALLRSALVVGWMTYGYSYGRRLNLGWVTGALALVSVLALAMAAWLRMTAGPDTVLPRGLEFLFITSNGMSIVGMVLVLLALLGLRHWSVISRVLLGLLGAGVLVLGLGKAAWLALGVGLLLSLRGRWGQGLRWGMLVLAALALAVPSTRAQVLTLFGNSLSGREQVWTDASRIFSASPLGGTGPYQYGASAAPFGDPCATLRTIEAVVPSCPAWVEGLSQPWIIAHNGTLQALAETGLVGAAGWFLLYGAVLLGAWKSRWPLARALTGSLLVVNTVDNAILLPSPGYAELFLVLGGASWAAWLARPEEASQEAAALPAGSAPALQLAALGGAVGVGTAAVPWLLAAPTAPVQVELRRLLTPAQYQSGEVYGLYADLSWAQDLAGDGYLSVEQCSDLNICTRIGGARFEKGRLSEWVYARIREEGPDAQNVALRLTVADQSRLASALVLKEWKVSRVADE